MSRFEDFSPTERVVLCDALSEIMDTDDPEMCNWVNAAEHLYYELKGYYGKAEEAAGNRLNIVQ